VGGVLLAMLAGVCIALQVALIGRAADGRSALAIAMFVQGGGFATALAFLLLRGKAGDIADTATIVGTWLPAGVAGTIIVAALASSASQVGVATALGVSVAIQLAASLAWDQHTHLVARPVQALLGVALLAAGAWLVATARA
jgi:uncharacterized membrane protein YdcZ (DUF606 family)